MTPEWNIWRTNDNAQDFDAVRIFGPVSRLVRVRFNCSTNILISAVKTLHLSNSIWSERRINILSFSLGLQCVALIFLVPFDFGMSLQSIHSKENLLFASVLKFKWSNALLLKPQRESQHFFAKNRTLHDPVRLKRIRSQLLSHSFACIDEACSWHSPGSNCRDGKHSYLKLWALPCADYVAVHRKSSCRAEIPWRNDTNIVKCEHQMESIDASGNCIRMKMFTWKIGADAELGTAQLRSRASVGTLLASNSSVRSRKLTE